MCIFIRSNHWTVWKQRPCYKNTGWRPTAGFYSVSVEVCDFMLQYLWLVRGDAGGLISLQFMKQCLSGLSPDSGQDLVSRSCSLCWHPSRPAETIAKPPKHRDRNGSAEWIYHQRRLAAHTRLHAGLDLIFCVLSVHLWGTVHMNQHVSPVSATIQSDEYKTSDHSWEHIGVDSKFDFKYAQSSLIIILL